MKKKSTRELVRTVASEIMAKGKNPTVEMIRAVIGKGSATTISNELNLFRADLIKSVEGLNNFPDIPDEISKLFSKAWYAALTYGESRGLTINDEIVLLKKKLVKKNRVVNLLKNEATSSAVLIKTLEKQIKSQEEQFKILEKALNKLSS